MNSHGAALFGLSDVFATEEIAGCDTTTIADLVAIDIECHGATLAVAAVALRELHPHWCAPAGQGRISCNVEIEHPADVIAVLQAGFVRVQAPAAGVTALRENDTGGHRFRAPRCPR